MRALLLALVAAVVLGMAAAPVAPAGTAASREQHRLDASIRYLQDVQNLDGGFGGTPGGGSDPIFTSWVALALAAAGINPRDQALPGGRDAISYLIANLDRLQQTTDFERTLMVAVAAGMTGRSFGGRDLVTPIVARQLPDGSFPQVIGGQKGAINATAFAILALCLLDDPTVKPVIARAAAYLVSPGIQNEDGSWDWVAGAPGSSDMTAAVIQALRAAGGGPSEAEKRGFDYIATTQNDDGGFGMSASDGSNSMSTAWVLQAMWAVGADPSTWSRPGGTPLDYLASMQEPDGSVRYKADADVNRVWSTAEVAPALAGRQLPILPVPRADRMSPPPQRPPAVRDDVKLGLGEGGQTGASAQKATGAIYGGGGQGAPLFSQPEPDGAATPKQPRRRRDDRASGAASHERAGASAGEAAGSASAPAPADRPAPQGDTEEIVGTLVSRTPGASDPAPSMTNAGGDPAAHTALIVAGILAATGALGIANELRRRPLRMAEPAGEPAPEPQTAAGAVSERELSESSSVS
jgi:prenyltransferase beta subunit